MKNIVIIPPLEYQGDLKSLTALYEYYGLTVHKALNTNKIVYFLDF